jgi:5'-3' exonuclease
MHLWCFPPDASDVYLCWQQTLQPHGECHCYVQTKTAEEIEKYSKRTVRVTKQHNDECKRLLTLLGVPIIEVRSQVTYDAAPPKVQWVHRPDVEATAGMSGGGRRRVTAGGRVQDHPIAGSHGARPPICPMQAPSEAEAQCAALCKAGSVYAMASEDMDSLTFATPRLTRNLLSPASAKLPVTEYEYDKVLRRLDRQSMSASRVSE